MSKSAKNVKSVIVTVDDNGLKNINKIADGLSDKGMKIEKVLPITGVIQGKYNINKLEDIKNTEGVLGAEEELTAYPTDY